MSKYSYCLEIKCPKFLKEESKVLLESESAFDCAIDMWHFVDECSLTCQKQNSKSEENNKTP